MESCKHREGQTCALASQISNQRVEVSDQHCDACCRHGCPPQSINQITVSLGFAAIVKAGEDPNPFLTSYGHHTVERQEGPGTELEHLISWFYSPSKHCGTCSDRVRKMNRWGSAKCRRRKRLIIAWLRQSAQHAGLPFSATAASVLIDIALAKSEASENAKYSDV